MKTAISIPDKIFETAEKLAKRRGQSRSHLYAQALNSYVEKHYTDDVTENLNKIYDQENSSIDAVFQNVQSHSLPVDSW